MTQQFHREILSKLQKSGNNYSVTLVVKTPSFTAMLSGLEVESIYDNKITLDDDDKICTTITLENILEIKLENEDGHKHYYVTVI